VSQDELLESKDICHSLSTILSKLDYNVYDQEVSSKFDINEQSLIHRVQSFCPWIIQQCNILFYYLSSSGNVQAILNF